LDLFDYLKKHLHPQIQPFDRHSKNEVKDEPTGVEIVTYVGEKTEINMEHDYS
jgi:hypothetical protein